jgi:hypothetical protein
MPLSLEQGTRIILLLPFILIGLIGVWPGGRTANKFGARPAWGVSNPFGRPPSSAPQIADVFA